MATKSWVKVSESAGIEVFSELPASHANISNFPAYPHPEEYGFYPMIQNIPAYDPEYYVPIIDTQEVINNNYVVTYKIVPRPIQTIKITLRSCVMRSKSALEAMGCLFKSKLYSATGSDYEKYLAILKDHNDDYTNMILCTDIEGVSTEYSFYDFKALTMMVGEYRACVNSHVSQLLTSIQEAHTVEQLKQLDEAIKKTNHHKILMVTEQRLHNSLGDKETTS